MNKEMASNSQDIATRFVSLFTERRLPWRLSQWLDRRRQESMRKKYDQLALETQPYITSKDNPYFEVHVLLGHRHVGMTLWCIKSFLHYSNKKYFIVLHEDGSLTNQDIANLERHLINVRIVRKAQADELIEKKLQHLQNCREYRFSPKETSDHRGLKYDMHIFAMRLFDFNLVSDATKIIVLDCDVLFFAPPLEIMEWAEDPEDINSLFSIEQYIPIRNTRHQVIGFEKKNPLPTDANAGLLCLDKRAYKLKIIDDWIGRNRELMDKVATFEQRAYNHLVQLKGGSTSLPDSYSFNYTDDHVKATHFAIKSLFFKNLERLRSVLAPISG